ncbi:MAG: tetratricopeptide repeat protein [Stappiaceae bacterium]
MPNSITVSRQTPQKPSRGRAMIGSITLALIMSVSPMATAETTNAEKAESDSYPSSLSGSYLAARFAGTSRDIENAAQYFHEALKADPENAYLLDRSFTLLLANGNVEAAVGLANRLIAQDKTNMLGRIALGAVALKERSFSKARKELNQAGSGPLADLTGSILTAWSAHGAGNTDDAISIINKLSGPDWFSVFTAYHAGLMLEQAGRHEEAAAQFARAYEIDKGALRIVQAHARALAKAGKNEKALEVLDLFDRVIPSHPIMNVARSAIVDKRDLRSDVLNAQDGAAELLYGLGSAIGRDGGEELSAIYLQLALFLKPNAELAYLSLANLFEQLRQYERANEVLAKIEADSPLKRNAQIQVGLNHNALDNLEEARSALSEIIVDNPSDLEASIALGNVYRSHKMFDDAAKVYGGAIDNLTKVESHHWQLFYYRGISLERVKEWDGAEADFLKALELYPDQPLVLNYLGYSWVDRGLNYARALGMIKKAVELRPNDGYIVDSLGWVYFMLGRYEEAAEQLERAVELRPEDPIINDHLGDAYWKVGRELEARFQWSHARDLEPEQKELEYILLKLKNGYQAPPNAEKTAADNGN